MASSIVFLVHVRYSRVCFRRKGKNSLYVYTLSCWFEKKRFIVIFKYIATLKRFHVTFKILNGMQRICYARKFLEFFLCKKFCCSKQHRRNTIFSSAKAERSICDDGFKTFVRTCIGLWSCNCDGVSFTSSRRYVIRFHQNRVSLRSISLTLKMPDLVGVSGPKVVEDVFNLSTPTKDKKAVGIIVLLLHVVVGCAQCPNLKILYKQNRYAINSMNETKEFHLIPSILSSDFLTVDALTMNEMGLLLRASIFASSHHH